MTESVWDAIYEGYTGPDLIDNYIYSKLIKLLQNYVNKGDAILEAGCGSGYLVSYFQNQGNFSVGLDRYDNPLRIARYTFKSENLVKGDIFNLPFRDSSVEIVWNEGVLEHFRIGESIRACKEMARVSRKYVIVDVPNKYKISYVIGKWIKKLVGAWMYGYEESYSPKRLRCLMESAGLSTINIYGVYLPPMMTLLKNWKSALHILFLEMPLPEKTISKILNRFSKIEDSYPKLSRLFGFHLIIIGRKGKIEGKINCK